MTHKDELIAALSAEAKPLISLPRPAYWIARILVLSVIYIICAQLALGLRPDISIQLAHPFFAIEIGLQLALLLTSVIAAILSMYPDAYQKPGFIRLPYVVFLLLMGILVLQLMMPSDIRMVALKPESHTVECALYIGLATLIPSALMFFVLHKGASIRPWQTGSFAVLSASAMGCLTLRLHEPIDVISHLLQWHYIPTLLFALLGALLGKWLLKWW